MTMTSQHSEVEKHGPKAETFQVDSENRAEQDSQHHGPGPKKSRLRRLLWDSLDKSPEERLFVNKADWFIVSYVCVGYFVKYLDQNNVRRQSLLMPSAYI